MLSEQHQHAILADLNPPQRQAVEHRDGPLLVLAGPGSGKTRVITRRAAWLVHSGIAPSNVLAITFTNKAAEEMRKRIGELGVGRGMWVYTFHALGARLLREFGPLANVEPGFTIFDETDALRVVKQALEVAKISDAALKPDQARAAISDAKSRLLSPTELRDQSEWYQQDLVARVYETYQQLLIAQNAVDFDDLLMRVARVLLDHPDITERLNVRFRYVLIDEYQDTNRAQYLIARELSKHHNNICATGDPDQSIYAWRGADIRNILEFERDYPDAVVVRLEQNYRSHNHILRAASRLIRKNRHRKHKELWSDLGDGKPLHVWQFADNFAEADHIADRIAALHRGGRPFTDFAIFYRVNAVSRGLEEALRRRGIPYRIARGVEFYNRKEIRDVLAYLRVLVNPADEVALLRIINTPARGIGKTSIERLRAHATRTGQTLLDVVRRANEVPDLKNAAKRVRSFADLMNTLQPCADAPPSEAISAILTTSGLERDLRSDGDTEGEDRLANVQELVTAAVRFEQEHESASLIDFLNLVSLASDQDRVDEQAGVVMLMTLHAAKGLEFPVVFLVGLEQGLLPHERSLGVHDKALEEERRLCFVGVTRAQRELYLSHAAERVIRGQPLPRAQSQFLMELDDGDMIWEDNRPQRSGPRRHALQDDGFVPLGDDLPPEEAERMMGRRTLRLVSDASETVYDAESGERLSPEPPARRKRDRKPPPSVDVSPAYADWKAGTFVEHDKYGVGQILWIRPGPGQTRAGVRFPGHGEKTLVLEFSPIRKLDRHST